MKAPTLIIFVVTATAWADTINFDDVKAGTLPANWLAAQTGTGAAKWDVENGFVAVKFKPVAGKEDQAGGVIWRCKDKDNYYVARANALENNVTIYHTINGQKGGF